MPESRRPRSGLLLLALLALYVGVRLASLTRQDLWFDELFGVELGRLDLSGFFASTAEDQTNPPLFYLLIKGWMALGGTTQWWLRLLPFLSSVLGLAALLRLGEVLQLPRGVRLMTLALAALSPMLVFYSVELRAYALLFALGTLATAECAALVLRRDPGPWPIIRLAVVNALLPLVHYFGWTVIAAEGGVFLLLAPGQIRTLVRVTVPALLAFAPWAMAVAEAAERAASFAPTIAWIQKPGIGDLLRAPAFLVAGYSPGVDLAAGSLVLSGLIYGSLRGAPETRKTRLFLALFVAIPVLGALLATWLGPRSLWVPRNLIGAAVPALILLAFALDGVRMRVAAGAVLLCCLVGLVVGGGQARKTPWRAIATRLVDPGAVRLPVYVYERYLELPLRYYAEQEALPLDVRRITTFDSIAGRQGWVVVRPRAWPGAADGGRGFLERWGMRVTDSAATDAPDERVESWRWEQD